MKKFIKYVKVDYRDRTPETEFPARHGPDDPVPGIQQLWFDNTTNPVVYYGQIEGQFDESTPGVLQVYTEAEFEPILAARAQHEAYLKRAALDDAREAAFNAGMPYTFGEIEDVVPTRMQDRMNLLAIAIEAQAKLQADPEGVIEFRAESNTTYQLTPQEAIDMVFAALAHIRDIYARTWVAKDELESILTGTPSIDLLQDVRAVAYDPEG